MKTKYYSGLPNKWGAWYKSCQAASVLLFSLYFSLFFPKILWFDDFDQIPSVMVWLRFGILTVLLAASVHFIWAAVFSFIAIVTRRRVWFCIHGLEYGAIVQIFAARPKVSYFLVRDPHYCWTIKNKEGKRLQVKDSRNGIKTVADPFSCFIYEKTVQLAVKFPHRRIKQQRDSIHKKYEQAAKRQAKKAEKESSGIILVLPNTSLPDVQNQDGAPKKNNLGVSKAV